jgi:hypothetical protein
MLPQLTALQLAEMIAYERIDQVPVSPEEKAAQAAATAAEFRAEKSDKIKELFRKKGFSRG